MLIADQITPFLQSTLTLVLRGTADMVFIIGFYYFTGVTGKIDFTGYRKISVKFFKLKFIYLFEIKMIFFFKKKVQFWGAWKHTNCNLQG